MPLTEGRDLSGTARSRSQLTVAGNIGTEHHSGTQASGRSAAPSQSGRQQGWAGADGAGSRAGCPGPGAGRAASPQLTCRGSCTAPGSHVPGPNISSPRNSADGARRRFSRRVQPASPQQRAATACSGTTVGGEGGSSLSRVTSRTAVSGGGPVPIRAPLVKWSPVARSSVASLPRSAGRRPKLAHPSPQLNKYCGAPPALAGTRCVLVA